MDFLSLSAADGGFSEPPFGAAKSGETHRKKHNGIRVEPTDEKRPKVEWWSIFK